MKHHRWGTAFLLLLLAGVSVALALAGAEGSLRFMTHAVSCWAVGLVALLSLLAGLAGAGALRSKAVNLRRLSAVVLHLGFALVLGGWVYNAAKAPEEGYLELHAGRAGAVADAFEFKLADFTIDRWPDTGTVRQYTSRGLVLPPGGTAQGLEGEPVEISVNHPLVKDGWWVYQSSFREMENPHTGRPFYITVLDCVKDVGLPYVFAGGLLLLLGALGYAILLVRTRGRGIPAASCPGECRTVHDAARMPRPQQNRFCDYLKHGESPRERKRLSKLCQFLYALAFAGAVAMLVHRGIVTGHPPMQNMYEFLMCAAALVPILTFLSAKIDRQNTLLVDSAILAILLIPVGFPIMDGSVKHLMPALQSPFFVPHVGAYVLGYLLLVRAALGAGRRLVGVGYFLLTVGLVLGATWGKVCWGHWWQFDPKEMWSLATWLVYAAYFHVKPRLNAKAERVFLCVGAVMIVLTLTWINLSRIFTGMHSYA